MAEDLNKLEQTVSEELSTLSPKLSADPPEAVLRRAVWTVREELNELWFEQLAPVPTEPKLLARVKAGIHREVARVAAELGIEYHPPLVAATGRWVWRLSCAVGAAAVILLCVGVIRYGEGLGRLKRPEAQPPTAVELFLEAGTSVAREEAFADNMSDELLDVEDAIAEWQQLEHDTVEERLEQISEEIDDLFIEPEPEGLSS